MATCGFAIPDSEKEKLEELMKDICVQRRKYNEYQLLHNVIYECVKESCELGVESRSKILDVLMVNNLQSCMELRNNCTLLGLNFNLTDLTYEENENLKKVVQLKLIEKRRNIFKELRDLGVKLDNDSTSENPSSLGLDLQEKLLLDLKQQLNEKQELCFNLLQKLRDVLEKLIDLKTTTLSEMTNNKIKTHQTQIQLFCVKAKILDVQLKVKVFSETSSSLTAYKELSKDILEQQKDLRKEIEKLQELKEKYKQVSCKQYDDILKNYIHYQSNIEKKRLLYNHINKK